MKTLITILTGIILSINNHCQAQTWNEWFNQKKTQKKYLIQQITALEVYLGYVKKGYEIAHDGLTLIGDIKDGNFSLHKDYFTSLEKVNPVIHKSSKAAYAFALQNLIKREIESQYQSSRKDANFTAGEMHYLTAVYANLNNECDASVDELTSLLTDHNLQMQDNQRLDGIDRICENLKSMYSFLRTFNPSLLSMQRNSEKSSIESMKKINDVQP